MNRLPAQTTVATVTLKVARLEPTLAFYHEVVGLRLRSNEPGRVTLGSDEDILVLLERPGAQPTLGTTGLYHLAILLPSRAHLAQWLRHASGLGIHIGAGDHDVSEAFYLNDPEGNGVEVYADRPRERWRRDGDGIYLTTRAVDTESLLAEAPSASWRGVPDGTTLGHVHLRVNDLQVAGAFYLDLLGFELMSDYAGMGALFVAAGGYHHHLGLNIWQSAGAPSAPETALGLDHYRIELPTATALAEVGTRLEQAKYPAEASGKGLRLVDPAGNRLHLTTP